MIRLELRAEPLRLCGGAEGTVQECKYNTRVHTLLTGFCKLYGESDGYSAIVQCKEYRDWNKTSQKVPHTHAHTCMHTHIHSHAHTDTHTHTYIYAQCLQCLLSSSVVNCTGALKGPVPATVTAATW